MQLIPNGHLPAMILVGLILFSGVFFGRMMHRVQLPALMGYMLLGIIIGPAAANILPAAILHKLDFVTELALGFVAISIGFELNFKILKSQGKQLLSIVVWESTVTFIVVTAIGLLVTGNTPLSLLLGAVGVATAPAGTVAVIQENNARGPFAR
ncbi:MAG: hypothetical protein D6B26_02620, partial [Spirochaetaceae bacterium]